MYRHPRGMKNHPNSNSAGNHAIANLRPTTMTQSHLRHRSKPIRSRIGSSTGTGTGTGNAKDGVKNRIVRSYDDKENHANHHHHHHNVNNDHDDGDGSTVDAEQEQTETAEYTEPFKSQPLLLSSKSNRAPKSIPISLSQPSVASSTIRSTAGKGTGTSRRGQVQSQQLQLQLQLRSQSQSQSQSKPPPKRSWMEACMDWTPYRNNKKKKIHGLGNEHGNDEDATGKTQDSTTRDSSTTTKDNAKGGGVAGAGAGAGTSIISHVTSKVLTTFQTPLRKTKNHETDRTDSSNQGAIITASTTNPSHNQHLHLHKELDIKRDEIKSYLTEMVTLKKDLEEQAKRIVETKEALEKASSTAQTTQQSLQASMKEPTQKWTQAKESLEASLETARQTEQSLQSITSQTQSTIETKQTNALTIIQTHIQSFEVRANEKMNQLTSRGKEITQQVDKEATVLDSVKNAFRTMMEGAKRHGETIWNDVNGTKGEIDAAKEEIGRLRIEIGEMRGVIEQSGDIRLMLEKVLRSGVAPEKLSGGSEGDGDDSGGAACVMKVTPSPGMKPTQTNDVRKSTSNDTTGRVDTSNRQLNKVTLDDSDANEISPCPERRSTQSGSKATFKVASTSTASAKGNAKEESPVDNEDSNPIATKMTMSGKEATESGTSNSGHACQSREKITSIKPTKRKSKSIVDSNNPNPHATKECISEKEPKASGVSNLEHANQSKKKKVTTSTDTNEQTNSKKSQRDVITTNGTDVSKDIASKEKKVVRRSRRKQIKPTDPEIPSCVELPSTSEDPGIGEMSPLSVRSFVDAGDAYCRGGTSNEKKKSNKKPARQDLHEQSENINRSENQNSKKLFKCRYNLRSNRESSSSKTPSSGVGAESGFVSHVGNYEVDNGHMSADRASSGQNSGAGKNSSGSLSHEREKIVHGTQLRVPARECAKSCGGPALSQNQPRQKHHGPPTTTTSKRNPNRPRHKSGKVKIQVKSNMSIPPAPNTPGYKTPVTSVRKGNGETLGTSTGPKPHAQILRKRKRGTYRRARINKHTTSRSSPSSNDLLFNSGRNMLGSLRLSSLNISDNDENNHVSRASANPPAIITHSRAKDIISPNGLKALTAPIIPELDEQRYWPKRRILKARNQGPFQLDESELQNDVFDFN